MITIKITPPTGLENNAIIYIAVGAVALIVLAGGIYLIKKKVIFKLLFKRKEIFLTLR